MFDALALVLAALCFLLAAVRVKVLTRFELVALGLFLWILPAALHALAGLIH
jgi:hypothetical protein